MQFNTLQIANTYSAKHMFSGKPSMVDRIRTLVEWNFFSSTHHFDNQVTVACLRSRTSKHKGIMHLLRSLVFIEAHFLCHLQPVYIDTKANHLADDLSRNNVSSFLPKVPQAHSHPSPPIMDLLLDPRADWTSHIWHNQFNSIFRQD